MKCFYHSADLDGFSSAAIVKYKFKDCELYPINYNDKFPWDEIKKNEQVFMVDFSLKSRQMMKLYEKLKNNFIHIDHHITAINDLNKTKPVYSNKNLDELINGLRYSGKAACELVWEFLFTGEKLPKVIEYLGNYDVWKLKENVLAFQYGFRIFDTNPNNQEFWSKYFNASKEMINDVIDKGNVILEFVKLENEKYCQNAFEVEFEGYKTIVVNKLQTSSQLFESVWNPDKYDLMMAFGLNKKGVWNFSIYTAKDNVDCSQLARKYGGGGHKSASGFALNKLPF